MRDLTRKLSASNRQAHGGLAREGWLSIGLACITSVGAAVYLYGTSLLHVPDMVDPVGPTTFPYLIGICLLLCAGGLVFEGVSKGRVARQSNGIREKTPISDYIVSLGTIVWTLLYYAAFSHAGYVISTAVFLFGLMTIFHRGHLVTNLLVSLGFSVVSFVIFTRFFEVMLPSGPFFGGAL